MSDNFKKENAYKTIGEVAKELGLIDRTTGHIQTHTIRYWESKFKELKPITRAGNRRYYSPKDLKMITYIKYLLKDKGLTIKGVKKILKNNKEGTIDDKVNLGIYKPDLKTTNYIKKKVINISNIIKEIKKLKDG
jgi:DNA-binding transcriptional MerR regulator